MASFTVPCPKASSTYIAQAGSNAHQVHQQSQNQLSFQLLSNPSHIPSLAFSGFQCPTRKQSAVRKLQAQLNEVTAEKSSNSIPATKSGAGSSETKVQPVEKLSDQNNVPVAASVSAFMTRVSDLVKLVDSRDIVELQLKQLDCEIIIRKKEALQQPTPSQVPHAYLPSPPLPAPAPAPASAPAPPSPSPSISQPALPIRTSSSSHPPLKCPMPGTFYRSPQPGEPPFVKVGDKVKQGQVVCIIEAMKLMNDIEADQSGTVTEILVEDGKPVSVDTPLFVIVP